MGERLGWEEEAVGGGVSVNTRMTSTIPRCH